MIRVSDSYVKTSFLSGISLPGKTFDIDFDRILTRSQTKMVKENPDIYKLLPSNTTFEWITKESPAYHLKLRIVQIQLDDGSIQCFATNCSRDEFPPEKVLSADARQFITFQTKSGKVFHLIINHDEKSENVMLLTEVSENDLMNMVETKENQKKPL